MSTAEVRIDGSSGEGSTDGCSTDGSTGEVRSAPEERATGSETGTVQVGGSEGAACSAEEPEQLVAAQRTDGAQENREEQEDRETRGQDAGERQDTGEAQDTPEGVVLEEGGAWDDGLIARRARGTEAPYGRPGRPRWGVGAEWAPDSVVTDADGGEGSEREAAHEAAGGTRRGAPEVRTHSERPWTGPHLPGLPSPGAPEREGLGEDEALRGRLVALWKLIDLSGTRLPGQVLAEAGRVLDAAGARGGLPRAYTTVAIAGATGSGKSSLFNALAGARLSNAGMRRPTTATPVACTWEAARAGTADGLLDRLAIAPSARRLMRTGPHETEGCTDGCTDNGLAGLVLIDLPDHDSVATGHREQVDRMLRLVDAVVWVVDPEKYADAMLHERYLRPLAGYAEVTFVVLNQTDRLPGEATAAVLNDLRRLLDEDGMALGEHGEPGARVLATSALTGEGIDELRAELGTFVADHGAAALRLSADLDGAMQRLRPVYAEPGPGTVADAPTGLTDAVREDFADLLACAAGAVAAGQAAERTWLRHAERACGTPWTQLGHWYDERRAGAERTSGTSAEPATEATGEPAAERADSGNPEVAGGAETSSASGDTPARVARPVVAHAVRTVVDQAAAGLPEAWRRSVRDAAWRGAGGLPEALDDAVCERTESDAKPAGGSQKPPRALWWTAAFVGQAALLGIQVLGLAWVLGTAAGLTIGEGWMAVTLLLGGALSGALLAWGCRMAARGPARAHGEREELRLRRLVAECGEARVLKPVAAELLRYREVREQYVIAAGEAPRV